MFLNTIYIVKAKLQISSGFVPKKHSQKHMWFSCLKIQTNRILSRYIFYWYSFRTIYSSIERSEQFLVKKYVSFFERERNKMFWNPLTSNNDNKWDRADKIKINRENLQKKTLKFKLSLKFLMTFKIYHC